MNKLTDLIASFAVVFIFISPTIAQQIFVANVNPYQAGRQQLFSPPVLCKLKFNQLQGELSCRYFHSSQSSDIMNVNIHIGGGVGQEAPLTHSFEVYVASIGQNQFTLNFSVSSEQLEMIRANKGYVRITSNTTGLIRGQIHLANSAYNDFDGDGRTDLTVYRSSNRTFYVKTPLIPEIIEQQIGQSGDSVSLTVDFDGDGASDFSTAGYNGTFVWRIIRSGSGAYTETQFGSSAFNDIFAAGDYDGDGRFDIAVFRAGVWYIIESSTGNYCYEYFGQSGDVPAANDYDKDGKADLTVARSENGVRVWYVRRSSDNQAYRVEWGLSSDAFFTGRSDWDGDGAADISVIRNESGQRVFYIRRSSDNQLQIIRWGASSDVVKLGDYDGDGKTDAAVTRAVNGGRVFFILQSSNNQPRYEYFGLAGDF